MKRLLKFFKDQYFAIIQSIAFYPVFISITFFTLAIVVSRAENWEFITAIKKNIPQLLINDYETARAILTTLIGGILSLTVFSFSMVMLVLNQASANFSPRLLPNLISNKRHQIILGFYVGTLLYCVVILISLGANDADANSMGLSTMIAAIFGVICVALFVFFIHGISSAILIHNIVDRLFDTSRSYFKAAYDEQYKNAVPLKEVNNTDWNFIKSPETGYFRDFDISLLSDKLKEQKNQIEVMPYANQHLWKGDVLFKVKDKITEEELEDLMVCTSISLSRHEGEKGLSGMIKLMEVAVKAMSPGINDPGTAISVIHRLGELSRIVLVFPPKVSAISDQGNMVVIKNNISAKELMRLVIQPLRLYSKKDNSVLFELIKALKYIEKGANISDENKEVIAEEMEALKADIEMNIESQKDKKQLLEVF